MHPDFSGKTLLITGGTGSFGNGAVARLLETGIGEIRIFSRDEKKQDDMRNLCRIRHPASWGKLRFYLGDVREPGSLRAPMEGADYVIHAAALKQVPSCEFFPLEAVRTNVLGTEHVLEAAAAAGVAAADAAAAATRRPKKTDIYKLRTSTLRKNCIACSVKCKCDILFCRNCHHCF